MTIEMLETKTRKDLARLARERRVAGWHDMSKAELVRQLARLLSEKDGGPVVRRSTPSVSAGLPDAGLLRQLPRKDLVALARERGLATPASLSKDALVDALVQSEARRDARATQHSASRLSPSRPRASRDLAPAPAVNRRSNPQIAPAGELVERSKYYIGSPSRDLAARTGDLPPSYGKDRIVTMVRDPYWLHVYWEITAQAVHRASAALGQDWYASKPILRLIDVTSDDAAGMSETVVRDVEIHGGVNNWYLDVKNPPRSYRVDIGYLSPRGRFFALGRSNVVTTPRPGMSEMTDAHWESIKSDAERVYALSSGQDSEVGTTPLKELFEERLRRPMSSGSLGEYGSGALSPAQREDFHFRVDAELIVYGATNPSARVTLQGEPLQLRPDGTFTMRFCLPDGRQILPVTASTRDGLEERTVILAIERNTKELEPMVHDGQD